MKNKRAQGMSINLIVVAGIALLVLIIIVAIFASRIGKFSESQDSCAAKGGTCLASCTPPATFRVATCGSGDAGYTESTKACCITGATP